MQHMETCIYCTQCIYTVSPCPFVAIRIAAFICVAVWPRREFRSGNIFYYGWISRLQLGLKVLNKTWCLISWSRRPFIFIFFPIHISPLAGCWQACIGAHIISHTCLLTDHQTLIRRSCYSSSGWAGAPCTEGSSPHCEYLGLSPDHFLCVIPPHSLLLPIVSTVMSNKGKNAHVLKTLDHLPVF